MNRVSLPVTPLLSSPIHWEERVFPNASSPGPRSIAADTIHFGLTTQQSLLPQSDNGIVHEGVDLLISLLDRGGLRRQITDVLPLSEMDDLKRVLTDPDIAKPVNTQVLVKSLEQVSKTLDSIHGSNASAKAAHNLTTALLDVLHAKKVILVPGFVATKNSFQKINRYIENNLGFETTTVKLFPIATGLGVKNLAPLLGDYIDDYRILASRANARLLDIILDEPGNPVDKVRRMLSLKNSKTGNAIAKACLDVYRRLEPELPGLKTPMVHTGPKNTKDGTRRFEDVIKGINPETAQRYTGIFRRLANSAATIVSNAESITMHRISRMTGYEVPHIFGFITNLLTRKKPDEKLSTIVSQARTNLARTIEPLLKEKNLTKARQHELAQKLANRGTDLVFNRMILMGHSMGGLATLKAMQQSGNAEYGHSDPDISINLCLGTPVNGIKIPLEGFEGLGTALAHIPGLKEAVLASVRQVPAIRDMEAGSKAIRKIQSRTTFDDTTTISIANPEDGIVHAADAHLRTDGDNVVNHHNFMVTPEKTSLLASTWVVTDIIREVAQHCAVVQHPEKHFAVEGSEIMEQIFTQARQPEYLQRLLHPKNNELLREHIVDLITDRMAQDPELRQHYCQPELREIFEAIAAVPTPLIDGIDTKAKRLLRKLDHGSANKL